MKTKIASLVLVGLIVLAANVFAEKGTDDFAIGAQLTSSNLDTVGGMLTLHIPKVPLFFGIGVNGGDEQRLAMTADYWLYHAQIAGMLNWYFGIGGYGALSTSDTSQFDVGVRFPVAIQIWPLDSELLEMFLEVAPAWVPITGDGFNSGTFQAQLALGFRVWP